MCISTKMNYAACPIGGGLLYSCFLTSCQIGNMKGVCVYFASILLGLTVIVNCSEESRLKRHLLFEYDRNTKPSEQVVVEIGMRPTNLNLCPHSQVILGIFFSIHTHTYLLITYNLM